MQVLNVALGGTLVQDVRLRPEWREHPSDPGWRAWKEMESASLGEAGVPVHPRHGLDVVRGTILGAAVQTSEIEVNSFHHQAVDRLGEGLVVSARAPDGVIEAVELPGRPVLAVQWELQEEWRVDRRFLRVFEWFVREAKTFAERGERTGCRPGDG
jgi:putative glutamine amidotransferase